MNIVIADDNRVCATVLGATLKQWGHTVTVASDGTQAWELLTTLSPPLAILDWMMPGFDGPELCRRIRQHPALSQMYVILLSARESREDMVAGLDAGADDYLTKSFDREELRARLQVGVRVVEANAETGRLLASISSILIGIDAQGCITRWNSAAQDAFGVAAADAIGRPLTACGVDWSDPDALRAALDHPKMSAQIDDLWFKDNEGRDRVLTLNVTRMQRGSEGAHGFVVLGSEVTERLALETQLRQSQKLEGIGQLAAGIAHEINTPMQYIGDNMRFLGDSVTTLDGLFAAVLELCARRAQDASADLSACLETVCKEVERADLEFLRADLPNAVTQSLEGVQHVSRIVKAMKDFSHPGTGEKVETDLNHAIDNTLVVARNEWKYVADTQTELDPNLPRVPCLPGEINQVFLNLVVNAAHAIGDVVAKDPEHQRGCITVSTHGCGDAVEIRISDTGGGIPPEIHHRIFEPFFTTKGVGRGTGQGLALAHGTIVGRHGGRIWFETEAGKGTTFFIRLPLAATDSTGAVTASAA